MLIAAALLACTQDSLSERSVEMEPVQNAGVGIEAQSGEKHPPIPADNPIWERASKSFQPVPMVYGEERWDDVLMRVIGHLAQASRDLARIHAQAGRMEEAHDEYLSLLDRLSAIPLGEDGQSRQVRDLHIAAAQLHAAVIGQSISKSTNPPEQAGPNATRRWHVASGQAPPENSTAPWRGLQIDAFEDFRDRHRLRLSMTRHWLDSVDPIHFSDPWGYWRPSVAETTASSLDNSSKEPIALSMEDYPLAIQVDELARLPTGDSYIDTAGGAGPMAIGRLAVLGADDKAHMKRLEDWATELNRMLELAPDQVVLQIKKYADYLNDYNHGSRFYNVKQLINTGTRHLARAGHYPQALEVFRMHRPLHAQDWLCPNREGIQLGIEGRLLALAGQEEDAINSLNTAKREANNWISSIQKAKGSGQGLRGPQGPPMPSGKSAQ